MVVLTMCSNHCCSAFILFCFVFLLFSFSLPPPNFDNQSRTQATFCDCLGKLVLFEKCKTKPSVSRVLSMWQNTVTALWSFKLFLKFLRVLCGI